MTQEIPTPTRQEVWCDVQGLWCDECDTCLEDLNADVHCDQCEVEPVMSREDWVAYGIKQGYCSVPFCDTHDGCPSPEEELELFNEGHDPCVVSIRLGNESEWIEDAKAYNFGGQGDSQ